MLVDSEVAGSGFRSRDSLAGAAALLAAVARLPRSLWPFVPPESTGGMLGDRNSSRRVTAVFAT